mgnify:CR=1 FL=1
MIGNSLAARAGQELPEELPVDFEYLLQTLWPHSLLTQVALQAVAPGGVRRGCSRLKCVAGTPLVPLVR